MLFWTTACPVCSCRARLPTQTRVGLYILLTVLCLFPAFSPRYDKYEDYDKYSKDSKYDK